MRPASMSVRAEMETLVAVSAPPRKSETFQERPNRWPAAAPSMKGQMTPESATRNAVTPASFMRSMSVSKPAMNISTRPPTCASSMKALEPLVPLNKRR